MTVQSASIICRPVSGHGFFATAVMLMLIVTGFSHSSVLAFEQLTTAQNLVYNTAHLSNTVAGQQINYRYLSQSSQAGTISDRVSVSVTQIHDEERRDVVLDFLSAERRMGFPDFTAFRGNPIIIAMLEHIAQGFGQETGGGVLYFRNRIRDALAKPDTRIEPVMVKYNNKTADATQIRFSPFVGDVYLVEKPEYTTATFYITLSKEVPGGVVAIAVKSSKNYPTYFEKEITLE